MHCIALGDTITKEKQGGYTGRIKLIERVHNPTDDEVRTPIIFHIPHSATRIPDDVRKQFILSDEELEKEILRMTDWHTDDLFGGFGDVVKIVFPVSRLVVDPERFTDDDLEAMSLKGMGVIYTKTSGGYRLRKRLNNSEKQSLLDKYYYPHHQCLEQTVQLALGKNGRCLVVDCHSFPSEPLPYEDDQSSNRPDICIGTDDFHTPKMLADKVSYYFESLGYKTALNRPFSGALVPYPFFEKNQAVSSIMIEVNRGLYMDEGSTQKYGRFKMIQQHLRGMAASLSEVIAV